MAGTKALILELRPKLHQQEGEPVYTEADVKQVMFAFARDLGCKWRNKRLENFINMVFYYVQPKLSVK